MADNNPTQAPLRLLAEQARASCEISDKHQSYLRDRIAQLRALADAKQAEGEVVKHSGRDGSAAQGECDRYNAQAQMLTQRVVQLMQEMYGSPVMAQQQPAERKPWQKPAWWQQLTTAVQGAEKIAELAGQRVAAIGLVCHQEVGLASAALRAALASKPEDARVAQIEPLLTLRLAARQMAALPWHLLDVDPQNGAQLTLLLKHLCLEMPELESPGIDVRAECLQRFDTLVDVMGEHKEAGRVEAARQQFHEENAGLSASILSGVVPPDPLRYEVNYLVNLITS